MGDLGNLGQTGTVLFCPKEGRIMKNVVKFLIIFAIIVISVIIIKKG